MGESLSEAPRRNTGFRRISADLLAVDRMAEKFRKLPEKATSPSRVLGAFKAAAPFMGIPRRLVDGVDWLFRHTQPQDWQEGSRPIIWPSARTQQEELRLGRTQAKALNRDLIRLGLVAMKDSPNGHRYGRRNPAGKIIEAYGFDLSPLAERYNEFVAIAAEAKATRAEMGKLRRRRSIAQTRLTQMVEAAREYRSIAEAGKEAFGEAWQAQVRQTAQLALALKATTRVEEMTHGVESLERRVADLRKQIEAVLLAGRERPESDPSEPDGRPHQYNYNPPSNPSDTVTARQREGSPVAAAEIADDQPASLEPKPDKRLHAPDSQTAAMIAGLDALGTMGVRPGELLDLAPRLGSYVTKPNPTWREIQEAADWLSGEMGISKHLWNKAIAAIGPTAAIVAVAIVSTKPKEFFTDGAGGYFHAMIERGREGTLHLDRSIWALRTKRRKA